MKKIDGELLKIITAEQKEQKLECFVYVRSLEYIDELKRRYDIEIIATYPFINLLYVVGKPDTIYTLSKHDYVKFVSSTTNVTTLVEISKKVLKADKIDLTGKNVTICYIDTGIFTHLDFCLSKNRIIKFIDLINGGLNPYDDNGHGTFVSGVGSGNGIYSGRKYSGFAPNSNIVSIKALNEKGEASASKILEAMQWVYTNHKQYNIKVVCMSFGSEPLGINDPIMRGADMLWKTGLTVVAAAGNSGPEYETIKSPGISGKIITVGGINDNRINESTFNENFYEIAQFSSRGPALRRYKPDLVSPSVQITSCSNKKDYCKLSGTSVSTPMVAGVCACAYEYNPNLKPDYLKRLLLSSCTPITFNRNFEGYGLLNVEKFVYNLKNAF